MCLGATGITKEIRIDNCKAFNNKPFGDIFSGDTLGAETPLILHPVNITFELSESSLEFSCRISLRLSSAEASRVTVLSWFDNYESGDDIYMITDYNGGIVIKECNYTYPVWVHDYKRADIGKYQEKVKNNRDQCIK